jgi:hypothetical protein
LLGAAGAPEGWVADRHLQTLALGEMSYYPWIRSPGPPIPSQAEASGQRCRFAFGISVTFSCSKSGLFFKSKITFNPVLLSRSLTCLLEPDGVVGMGLHTFSLALRSFVRSGVLHPGSPWWFSVRM